MLELLIIRNHFFGQYAALGNLSVYLDKKLVFECVTLERGWQQNEQNVSCVPEGTYPLVFEHSPKFKKHLWELKQVPGRSECKFHAANYWKQLNGCIALGNKKRYIDGDLIMDVSSSRDTMGDFHKAMEAWDKKSGYPKLTIENALNLIGQ